MREMQLTPDEIQLAATHGILRRHKKLLGLRGDRMQKERSNWDNEIEGVCAELAWCKLFKIYWSGLAGIRAKDGGAVDVRWTKHFDRGGLIIYPNDDDETVIVLSDGFAPIYRFIGWLRAGDGKNEKWLTKFGYLVPRSEIRSL